MNLFFEQNVYILIVVFLRDTLGIGLGLIKTNPTFATSPHGSTTRHPAFFSGSDSEDAHQLGHLRDLSNLAYFGDAEHRGPNWYDYRTSSEDSDSLGHSDEVSSTSSSSSESIESSVSSGASSFETRERKLANRVYRTCTPCPHDMLKKYKNMGIKWICGGYQRARRSFKSECMMRYRNCQDGTLFVKMYDHKCNNDAFHGRHFFYHYRA